VKFRGSFAYQRQPCDNNAPPPTSLTERISSLTRPVASAQWPPPAAPKPWEREREAAPNGPSERPATPAPSSLNADGEPAAAGLNDLVERATELANRHDYEQAVQLCDQSIRLRGPSAPAFYLLGMIRHALGDHVQAEQHLSRAVYLDGQHEEALLALSLIARRRGDHAAASNYQRRAERARQRKTT
jgi:chemotaxis protein methyltransferase WspC